MQATLDARRIRLTAPPSHSSEGTPPVLLDGVVIGRARRSTSRLVFGYGRYIVKVGHQSRNEVEVWDGLPDVDRPYFAAPVAWGTVEGDVERRWWVAQRVLPIKRALQCYSLAEWQTAWEELYPVLLRNDIRDVLFDEVIGMPRPHNWTIVDDAPVVFDYAS